MITTREPMVSKNVFYVFVTIQKTKTAKDINWVFRLPKIKDIVNRITERL